MEWWCSSSVTCKFWCRLFLSASLCCRGANPSKYRCFFLVPQAECRFCHPTKRQTNESLEVVFGYNCTVLFDDKWRFFCVSIFAVCGIVDTARLLQSVRSTQGNRCSANDSSVDCPNARLVTSVANGLEAELAWLWSHWQQMLSHQHAAVVFNRGSSPSPPFDNI